MDNELFKENGELTDEITDANEQIDEAIEHGDAPLSVEEENEPTEQAEGESTVDYAALEQEDIAALRSEFSEAIYMQSLLELKNPERYGELRDMGLSPREAYLASGGKRQLRDNRMHLHSAVPRGASRTASIPESELVAARGIFGDMSDAQIIKLYNKVTK